MNDQYKNLCSRCGKERVVTRIWKEKVFGSYITTTESACPDKDCQKIVNKENKKLADKRKAAQLRMKQRYAVKP